MNSAVPAGRVVEPKAVADFVEVGAQNGSKVSP